CNFVVQKRKVRQTPSKKPSLRKGDFGTGVQLPEDHQTFTSTSELQDAIQKASRGSKRSNVHFQTRRRVNHRAASPQLISEYTNALVTSNQYPGEFSLTSRLSLTQLATSLKIHLIGVSVTSLPSLLIHLAGGAAATRDDIYYELVQHGVPQADYGEIWMALALAKGSELSSHSAVLASKSLPSIPTGANEEILDLRAQGKARHFVRSQLTADCFALAVSHSSPLRQRTAKSLSVSLAILSTISHIVYPPEDAKELLSLAVVAFETLLQDEGMRREYVDRFFEALWVEDIKQRSQGREAQLTERLIRKCHPYLPVDLEYYFDPLHLFSADTSVLSKADFEDAYWTNLYLVRALVPQCDRKTYIGMMEADVVADVKRAYALVNAFRTFRRDHFTFHPYSLFDPSLASSSFILYSSAHGPERYRTSLNIQCFFLLPCYRGYRRSLRALELFPQNESLQRLKQLLEEIFYEVLTRSVQNLELFAARDRASNKALFDGEFFFFTDIITLEDGAWFLSEWKKAHPELNDALRRIVRLWKHRAYTGKSTAEWVDAYEAFVAGQEVEEPVSNLEQVEVIEGETDELTPPSPKLQDFNHTIQSLLRPQTAANH
ncbi:hypothetical protein BT69DRAFT_1281166, partial [Atractiella rhizophila]